MSMVAEKHQSQLPRIVKNINAAFADFKKNNDRYHEYMMFTFETSLTQDETNVLNSLDRPVIEFNMMNAPVDRLCGEYYKQEPSIEVHPKAGKKVDPRLLAFLEGYFRHILDDAQQENTQYLVYREQLAGGFSGFKVFAEYRDNRTFEQDLKLRRIFEPTMVGFDPMATQTTKSDAKWFFELYPMRQDEVKRKWPKVDLNQLQSTYNTDLSWVTGTGEDRVIIVAYYYERKVKKEKIVELANKKVITLDEYKELMLQWQHSRIFEQAAEIVRMREVDKVYWVRYTVIENEVLEHEETIFSMPCNIFADGNSARTQEKNSKKITQFTKPYSYHARGIQQLTNLAGQALANDFENMVQHKFALSEEALPTNPDWIDALTNVQKASVIVSKAYAVNEQGESQVDLPLAPVQPVPRVAMPPEVVQTFTGAMQMMQNILGSYDASLGISNKQLSGVAIVEGATQSNASAMPYLINNILALNQAGRVILNAIPAIIKEERMMPIINKKGEPDLMLVNHPDGVSLDYDPESLNVIVKAGVNFEIAKARAVEQIIGLMKVSPQFEAFMNAKGLPILLDNLDFRGVDIVKDLADEFVKEQEQAAQQQQGQPNPQEQLMIAQTQAITENAKANSLKAKTGLLTALQGHHQSEVENKLKIAQLIEDHDQSENELASAIVKAVAENSKEQNQMTIAMTEAMLKKENQEHQHIKDIIEIAHKSQNPTTHEERK